MQAVLGHVIRTDCKYWPAFRGSIKGLLVGCQSASQDHGPWKLLCGGFGRAKVLGMDAITFPPLLLTISADRMVRGGRDRREGSKVYALTRRHHEARVEGALSVLLRRREPVSLNRVWGLGCTATTMCNDHSISCDV